MKFFQPLLMGSAMDRNSLPGIIKNMRKKSHFRLDKNIRFIFTSPLKGELLYVISQAEYVRNRELYDNSVLIGVAFSKDEAYEMILFLFAEAYSAIDNNVRDYIKKRTGDEVIV